jgi:sporulation protein YlmC with PRC-barrel domain
MELVNVIGWRGKKIIDSKGNIVGEVEAVDLDLEKWIITGLQVGLTNESALEAGFKRPSLGRIIVVVPMELISAIGDAITIKEESRVLKDSVKYLGWR